MRIATTASPVSGADVRERMLELHHRYKIQKSIQTITRALQKWKQIKDQMKILRSRQHTIKAEVNDELNWGDERDTNLQNGVWMNEGRLT
jgi:hypothetical protein